MDRRNFLRNSGIALGSALTTSSALHVVKHPKLEARLSGAVGKWADVRSQFELDHSHIQMSQMLLASHPKRVRDAIAKHRKNFDENPATYWEEHHLTADTKTRKAAAKYMACDFTEVALTDSTTMGMATLLNGFKLKPGDEVLHTTHDHYITDTSIQYACKKRGATYREIAEYADPKLASVDEIVSNIRKAIRPQTRVVVVTWVHSCTGVKLPIREIAWAIEDANAERDPSKRVYFCVDGVHGFGNQAEAVSELGCDFFAAGTHKWIYGPRGTGVIYAKKDAWDFIEPTIPAFSRYPYQKWLDAESSVEWTFGEVCTPGGFHAFEHRWSLGEAFEFQMDLDRYDVHLRTTELNSMLKDGIADMSHVALHTPRDPHLSAGINCFMVDGYSETEAVEYFHKKGIVASSSPYKVSYTRLTPCIINTKEEVEKSLEVLAGMA